MSITDHLIDFASAPVDIGAREMMRLSLFDWAACGIAGSQEADFEPFKQTCLVQGGVGEASVLGGGRAPMAMAALINGTLSHALDFDDTHFAHIGHPSVAVVPAVLAIAEKTNVQFDRMLDAALIGVEASIHVGLWLGRNHYQVGYHQTATAGAFGATLACAHLLGLTADQMRSALGLCASMASGIKAQFGTAGKPLNAGLAARSGVEASLWAQVGLTSAHDGLAGPLGFGETHHGAFDTSYLTGLGHAPWQIMTISHKFHACCHGLHAMLEALSEIDAEAGQVQVLSIATHPRWMSVCNIPDPETGLAAKFSYRHTAAMSMMGYSTARRENFSDHLACDSELIALRNKVTVKEDAKLSEMQARIRLQLTEGQVLTARHDLAALFSIDVRRDRLKTKARGLLGERLEDQLWQAVSAGDIAQFLTALARSDRGQQ